MNINKTSIELQSIQFVKNHKKKIIDRYANLNNYPPVERPFTFIMAGSPGAGKTEFSISLINELYQKDAHTKIVRIDADDIKNAIPQYNKKNSYLIQKAAIIGMEKIIDYVYQNNQNVLIDGTFSHYESSIKNIKRSIQHKRTVEIWYLYLDPKIAWDLTRKRERIEGRPIKKEDFISSFFYAKDNVNKVKKEFGKYVKLNLVKKDKNKVDNFNKYKLELNIDKVDNYLTIGYNTSQLNKILL